MNRRYRRKKKESKLKQIVLTHIEKNVRNYAIVSVIFLIGIVIGVIFINNTSESQSTEITTYITSFSQDLKENQNIDNLLLLKGSIKKNIVLAILLWFMGSTVIGISVVYLTICFRGFCLGYTISSIILSLGIRKRNGIFSIIAFASNYFIYSLYKFIFFVNLI
jgi:stage II sporulation protein M